MTAPVRRIGRYEVRAVLGEGGFGQVFAAHDPVLGRDVAIKVPRGDWWSGDDVIAEARALARLSHPAIVQVLDAGRDGASAYIVMELVGGAGLDVVLAAARRPWTPLQALQVLAGPAAAVDHAHRSGVIHGDLKPENLLAPRGAVPPPGGPVVDDGPVVKVADFGLGALVQRHEPRAAAAGLGDPRYAAPEAWRGEVAARSDVFSLAAILFHLVSGRAPVVGDSPSDWMQAAAGGERPRLRDVRPELPRGLEDAIAAGLAPRARERPASAGALIAQVRDALERREEVRSAVADARRRIAARPLLERAACRSCLRPLHPRASTCGYCGEAVEPT